MSAPQAPPRQATPSEARQYAHNVALLAVIACPVLALIPPRKLDVYTLGLVGTTAYSGNYLVRERSGRSIWQHVRGTRPPLGQAGAPLPPADHAHLHRDSQSVQHQTQRLRPDSGSATDELRATQSQREAWKMQREKEIRDDLDVGKGFGEMITDQIWEVWNWGRKKDDEDDG